jgi:hypothetical protein
VTLPFPCPFIHQSRTLNKVQHPAEGDTVPAVTQFQEMIAQVPKSQYRQCDSVRCPLISVIPCTVYRPSTDTLHLECRCALQLQCAIRTVQHSGTCNAAAAALFERTVCANGSVNVPLHNSSCPVLDNRDQSRQHHAKLQVAKQKFRRHLSQFLSTLSHPGVPVGELAGHRAREKFMVSLNTLTAYSKNCVGRT